MCDIRGAVSRLDPALWLAAEQDPGLFLEAGLTGLCLRHSVQYVALGLDFRTDESGNLPPQP